MQLPLATLLAILSASAFALPTTTTDKPLPSAILKSLPYGNSSTYNDTMSDGTSTSHSHNINDFDDPHYHYQHPNASDNASHESSEDPIALLRRNTYFGDIASYSDGLCKILVGKKVTLKDSKCIKFVPDISAPSIGINWDGGWSTRMQKLDPFTDDDCDSGIHNGTFFTPGSQGMMPVPSAGMCYSYQEWLNEGGPWKSVMGK